MDDNKTTKITSLSEEVTVSRPKYLSHHSYLVYLRLQFCVLLYLPSTSPMSSKYSVNHLL
jgi:hypothetical protein